MTESSDANTLPRTVEFLRKRDYLVVRELGAGACGKTVLLRDEQIDELLVCKKYSPQLGLDRAALFASFMREIKLLHQLLHRNVVRVFNYYVYPDRQTGYILMEYVDGVSIDARVKSHPETINDLFRQTVEGFTHLSEKHILHRDIRPQNILVRTDGVVKIIDLGFGKKIEQPGDFDKSVSLNWWCDPPVEVVNGSYNFGSEIYFVGKLFERLIRDNEIEEFQYTDLVLRMCSKDPGQRPGVFGDVLRELVAEPMTGDAFDDEDISTYQDFANEVSKHFAKIGSDAKYVEDIDKCEQQLRDVYQSLMLHEFVPDSAPILRCLVEGSFRYRPTGFRTHALGEFVRLLRGVSRAQKRVVIANLHRTLDAVQRDAPADDDDDVPF